MAAADCIEALARAREALTRYTACLDQTHGGSISEWGVEARKRISQMIWLISEIDKRAGHEAFAPLLTKAAALIEAGELASEQWESAMRPEFDEALKHVAATSEPMETLTEAFYWIAARTRAVIRELPKLKGFEAPGVRDIRNKLIEHPEKPDSGILLTSFAWAAETGPVLKNARHDHQTGIWMDRGLYVNAMEFADELDRKLAAAMKG